MQRCNPFQSQSAASKHLRRADTICMSSPSGFGVGNRHHCPTLTIVPSSNGFDATTEVFLLLSSQIGQPPSDNHFILHKTRALNVPVKLGFFVLLTSLTRFSRLCIAPCDVGSGEKTFPVISDAAEDGFWSRFFSTLSGGHPVT